MTLKWFLVNDPRGLVGAPDMNEFDRVACGEGPFHWGTPVEGESLVPVALETEQRLWLLLLFYVRCQELEQNTQRGRGQNVRTCQKIN